ncbi:MAG: alpha/beta fold hydrolase [Alphaproteobacteria bacterium]|nr:alpha/beta fold hydrolase [Alphaproteobacteria bacterium]
MIFYANILLFAFIGIITYIFVLYSFQRHLIFIPFHNYIAPQQTENSPFAENILTMKDGTKIMTWYAEGDKNKPAVLFFHGNAFQLSAYAELLHSFTERGYAVLMMEYRNFGNTQGKTLQKDIFSDAAETFDWLKTQNYPEIIVYGYSYGTSVASGLTSLRPIDKLILTAPFSSLLTLVKEKPVPFAGLVLKDRYPSEDFLRNYHNPLLIIHGTKDRLIPIHHGQIMYNAAASTDKTFVPLEGVSHKPIYFEKLNQPAIFEWLEKQYYDKD